MYINAASVIAHREEINEMMMRKKPLALAVSESCLTDQIEDVEIVCQGYKCMRVDSHSRMTGGCCVYVREDIEVEQLEQLQHKKSIWIITVKMKINEIDIKLSVVYRAPSMNKNEFFEFFCDWLEEYTTINSTHLLCGDFNMNLLKNDTYTNKLNNVVEFYGLKQLENRQE